MNGHELILELKTRRPGLKALLVTGYLPSGEKEQSWWVEQPRLAKPFSSRALHNAVVGLIGPP